MSVVLFYVVTRGYELTEDFVADVVFPDEVAQELLVHACLIDDLCSAG